MSFSGSGSKSRGRYDYSRGKTSEVNREGVLYYGEK